MRRLIGFERGVNLGGWMSHENYAKEHLDTFITEADVARAASWGVDHVRVPVDYNLFEQTGPEEPAGFAYLDKAFLWCRRHHLNLLLDLHKTAGFSYEAMYNETGFFDDEAYQQRFYALWESFARRYAPYADMMAFELLNELTDPAFMPAWNRIVAETVRRIRAIVPDVWILVGGYHNNAVEGLPSIEMPAGDDRMVYNFHCYDPLLFTHQGAYWVPAIPADYRLDYPVSRTVYDADSARMFTPDPEHPDHMPGIPFSADFFKARFADAAALAEAHDLPLYCGEYGVIELAASDAVLHWYRDIHAAFEHYGIGRCAWSYKQMNFGLIDRPDIEAELVKLL